jgi:hypothetical protein
MFVTQKHNKSTDTMTGSDKQTRRIDIVGSERWTQMRDNSRCERNG